MIEQASTRSKSGVNPLTIRKFHTYIGVLIAPSMLFFSGTGAYQLFGLHEGHPGAAYQPPAFMVQLSAVHKDQTFAAEHHGPSAGAKSGEQVQHEAVKPNSATEHHDGPTGDEDGGAGTLLLKWYFLIVALGMFFTTLLGQYLAFKYARAKRTIWVLTIIGTVVPVALLLI